MKNKNSIIFVLGGIFVIILLYIFGLLEWPSWKQPPNGQFAQPSIDSVRISGTAAHIKNIRISEVAKPARFYSSGQASAFYLVKSEEQKSFPVQIEILYSLKNMKWIDETSLSLFFRADKKEPFRRMPDSKIDLHNRSIKGSIPRSGTIVLLGLPSDQHSVDILRGLDHILNTDTNFPGLGLRLKRTCALIRCAGMNWIRNDRVRAGRYLGGIDPQVLERSYIGTGYASHHGGVETNPSFLYSPAPTNRTPNPNRDDPFTETGICGECAGMRPDILVEAGEMDRTFDNLFPERGILGEDHCTKLYTY